MIQAVVLDRFHVLRPLAVGGMGELFLADDEKTGELAVLKVSREDIGELGAGGRFEHEIQVLRRFSQRLHPLIPAWLADGDWNNRRCVAVGHVAGLSLAEMMARLDHRASVTTAVLLAIDVLNALHAVHTITTDDGVALGLVHRDVSPHNIVCDLRGRAHLIDFGVSVDAGFADATPGAVVGKLAYMAPEQAGAADVDGRADQFALGVVLWELLTGHRFFLGAPAHDPWPMPADPLLAHVPPSIATAVCQMLEAGPAARFCSCAAASAALQRASADLQPGEHTLVTTLDEAQRQPQRCVLSRTVTLPALSELVTRGVRAEQRRPRPSPESPDLFSDLRCERSPL